MGAFISVDPQLDATNPAQFNAYVYSGSNPLTWADPSGLDWFGDIVKAVNSAAKAVTKAVQTAVSATVAFVDKYKSEIVGAVVGIAVTVGCTVATFGVGVVGCAVLGGMAGGAVTSLMKSAETGQFSVGGLLGDIVLGGVLGGVTAGLGAVLGPVLKAGASAAGAWVKSAATALVKTVTAKAVPVIKTVTQKITNVFKPAGAKKPPQVGQSDIASNAAAGNAARDSIAASYPGSLTEQSFSTAAGIRRVNILTAGGEAIESKVGLTSLTSTVRSQILKDRLLVEAGDVQSVSWVFTRSAVTEKIGPTGPLAAALEAAGIPWSLIT